MFKIKKLKLKDKILYYKFNITHIKMIQKNINFFE